ncbi:MAG: hypothetical protein RLZZ480_40 [Candidatus Parcubacteria bacterium]|jgi:hypothetical protein
MSVTVKIFGLAEYSSKPKLEAAIKEFFSNSLKIASHDVNILFVACASQQTGSPVLVEVNLTSNHVFTPEMLSEFEKVFHKPTANHKISIGISYYTLFYSGGNPERQCKYHTGDLAFADWRKQPVEA